MLFVRAFFLLVCGVMMGGVTIACIYPLCQECFELVLLIAVKHAHPKP